MRSNLSFLATCGIAVTLSSTLLRTPVQAEERPWLGFRFDNSTYTSQLGANHEGLIYKGAIIQSVVSGGPAENAGLKPGDVIVNFNRHEINEASDLPELVKSLSPRSKIAVIVVREGKDLSFEVNIGTNPKVNLSNNLPNNTEQAFHPDIPDCNELAKISLPDNPMTYYNSAYTRSIEDVLGKRIYRWSDADLDSLKSKVYECKRQGLAWNSYNSQYFYMQNYLGAGWSLIETLKAQRQGNREYYEKQEADLAKTKEFMAKQFTTVADVENELKNDNLDHIALLRLKERIRYIRAHMTAPKDDIDKLDLFVKNTNAKIDDRLRIIDEEEHKKNETKQASDNALQSMMLYGMAELCHKVGYAFDNIEIDSMKIEVRKSLDDLSVPQEQRDKIWTLTQAQINRMGFDQLPSSRQSSECNAMRNTLTYAFPKVFSKLETIPKNPF